MLLCCALRDAHASHLASLLCVLRLFVTHPAHRRTVAFILSSALLHFFGSSLKLTSSLNLLPNYCMLLFIAGALRWCCESSGAAVAAV